MPTMQVRTARKPHLCDSCHWTASLRGVPTIATGHRYLRHVAFPDGDINHSDRPYSNTECVSCYQDRTGDDPLLVGACGTYCCVDQPCARPHRHDGEHSCRRCLDRKD
jgi:hypothetical protein